MEQEIKLSLRRKVTCPHCWSPFAPEQLRWVATHPDLLGDPRLGDEAATRFTPTRFDANANAIDIRGSACHEIACPHCHLTVPRAALELTPLIVSIAGTPSSGKSYFLAAMAWSLRKNLSGLFGLTFGEPDPQANFTLNEYERQQFHNPDREAIVRLAKTEEQGDLYDTVRLDDHVAQLPKPFLFTIRPGTEHPQAENTARKSRLLCLYDNAGESFLPGRDTPANRVTGHLWRSHAVMFLYDPTQDVRFRMAYQKGRTPESIQDDGVTSRQETILHEIAARLDKHRARTEEDRRRPLVIVLTKYDQWWPLVGVERLPDPWGHAGMNGSHAFHLGKVKHVSDAVRGVVKQFSPEVVTAADEFSDDVWYVPISATGCPPERSEVTGQLGFRPSRINPMWEAAPLLTILARTTSGLLPTNLQSLASSSSGEQK